MHIHGRYLTQQLSWYGNIDGYKLIDLMKFKASGEEDLGNIELRHLGSPGPVSSSEWMRVGQPSLIRVMTRTCHAL